MNFDCKSTHFFAVMQEKKRQTALNGKFLTFRFIPSIIPIITNYNTTTDRFPTTRCQYNIISRKFIRYRINMVCQLPI